MVLSQVLPQLRSEFDMTFAEASIMISIINIGTMLAFFLIRKADLWGRKRVLNITIAGYTICTALSAISQDALQFTLLQLCARFFLISEWGVAMVYAAEEFPKEKRGMVIGLIQGFSSFGSIACAGLTPLFLTTEWGWRSLYAVGIIPLILVAFARRNIKETERFQGKQEKSKTVSLFGLLKGPYRNRLLLLGLLWSLTYFGFSNAVTFWKDFIVENQSWTDAQVGKTLTIAAIASMPLIFASGTLLDKIGRKWGAVIIYLLGCAGVAGAFLSSQELILQVSLTLAIFGVSGVLPVLNSYATELFPTEIRSEAYAWGNNILGRVGYIIAPVSIAFIAEQEILGIAMHTGSAMAVATLLPMIALIIILFTLPETKGKNLEETARL